MQQWNDEQVLLSPSDLVAFLGCHHASFLDVKNLKEDMGATRPDDTGRLLQRKGLEHEAAYLQRLRDDGKTVGEIPKDGRLEDRVAKTLDAMRSGKDVIYQAVLFDAPWRGDADFLIRCPAPSALGNHSYEALDTKLARTAEPKHILQLCVYSHMLTNMQELTPPNMHLFLGDGKKHSFRLSDFFHYYARARQHFESYIRNPPSKSYPEPCSHCAFCKWHDRCTNQWETDDHLSLVANIQRSQMVKLRKAGIKTVAALASTSPDAKIPDLNRDVFARLRSQAILQHGKAGTGKDQCEIIPLVSNKGFARLPKPDGGDLFFDMEGDPLYPDGLEYLFGVDFLDGDKKKFQMFWAHDHKEEKKTFQRFMAFLDEHLKQHPDAHIYHYNHYETTALKRLACRHGVCEEQMDNLLRHQKFIDLYLVVRESIRTSEPGYSIKNMETFYMEKRASAVATAADSIVVYNQWRVTGNDELLRKIADYNETDCVSTRLLRDWLLTLKPDDVSWLEGKSVEQEEQPRKDWEIQYEGYQVRLGVNQNDPPPMHTRLSHLLEFHNREDKPQWWAIFDRQNRVVDELIDDTECLGGLQLTGSPQPEKLSLIYAYRFPPQDYKIQIGNSLKDIATLENAGTVAALNDDECTVHIKRGARREPLPKTLSLGPSGPINTKILRSAIYRHTNAVLEKPQDPQAITELLARNIPRIKGKKTGEPIITSDDTYGDALRAIAGMDHSYLFMQGPPGAGKTYTSSRIIVDLIQSGKKVGISSNSHKAIHNLLEKVEAAASEKDVSFWGVKKATKKNPETCFKGTYIQNETKTENMKLDADLFAGTAWTFANPHFEGTLDYLFIDEAGQVSTANVIAMATATENIILVGDQMQLGQPIQGVHPGEAGMSILEFLLGEHATIPAERGIFLGQTYRLRPSICRFISDAFYDGRLDAHESTSNRSLDLQDIDLPDEGIVMIPTEHEGCSQKSVEEGAIIQKYYQDLIGQLFTDNDGTKRTITENDILVVTPYNVQVNYLRSQLGENARVGTVDKFQGQEAPIVLISMVTSSSEDMPRNMEFLYSKNRLNVAISRAQCLAIVVICPKLLDAPCTTVEQMKLVNTFCWLDEYANTKSTPTK